MQRSHAIISLLIHINTFGNKQFDNFLVTFTNRIMQRSHSIFTLRTQIRSSSQLLFDGFDVSSFGSLK